MAPTQDQNQKTHQGNEKNFGTSNSDMGANNPVKKEGSEKRDNRDQSDKSKKNLGSQKNRDESIDMGRDDRSAR